jgi:hypothetical protein
MQPEDLLPTLIELSVAVAGFSGVVAALSPHGPSKWSPIQRALFSALLGGTAISVGVALIGMVLLAAPIETNTAWACTSAVHLICLVGIIILRVREHRTSDAAISAISLPILVAVCLTAIAQAANAVLVQAGWLCVAALSLYAFLGLSYFVILVRQLWTDTQDA